ncbi:uncharacterized protein LOC110857672 [Folsomia candida]|uniref:uncharacterized protein LOC110857672 n=1 Tax=Folsomia candida TaxID=158441 RepID=UPI000B8FB3A6|nr:uncharacterized protein LOC110857672 [Folsomia candida]
MHQTKILFCLVLTICGLVHCEYLTHSEAKRRLGNAGISIKEHRPSCTDRTNKDCTSLDNVRSETIGWLINFKRVAIYDGRQCTFIVTGGTEAGHGGGGKNTHAGGYKIDLRLNTCLDNFIQSGSKNRRNAYFRYVKDVTLRYNRTSFYKAPKYQSGSGAFLLREHNHWDALYPENPVTNWGRG